MLDMARNRALDALVWARKMPSGVWQVTDVEGCDGLVCHRVSRIHQALWLLMPSSVLPIMPAQDGDNRRRTK